MGADFLCLKYFFGVAVELGDGFYDKVLGFFEVACDPVGNYRNAALRTVGTHIVQLCFAQTVCAFFYLLLLENALDDVAQLAAQLTCGVGTERHFEDTLVLRDILDYLLKELLG